MNETKAPKVQTGPPYHCFVCGAASDPLIHCQNSGHLAEHFDSIAYLTLPPACRKAGHPARVAILDGAITSLVFPYDDNKTKATSAKCIALIHEALGRIALGSATEDESETVKCADCGKDLYAEFSPHIPNIGYVCYACLTYYVGRPINLPNPEVNDGN